MIIEEDGEITTRGAAVVCQIGSLDGGVGNVRVAGTIAPYKAIALLNGTLTMLPTGNSISAIGDAFNSADPSSISADGTLAFEIDGLQNGVLDLRTQRPGGSPLTIDPAANLEIRLLGDASSYTIGQEWTLVRWDISLTGEFSQGASFTSDEGHAFSVDYAGGEGGDDIVLRVEDLNRSGSPLFCIYRHQGTQSWRGKCFSDADLEFPPQSQLLCGIFDRSGGMARSRGQRRIRG